MNELRVLIVEDEFITIEAISAILEEMNWDTRIDYVIQNLNLDDDTDMDIDSDLAAIFLVPIADPISPPNLGNVVLYIEKQLKKGIRPFSKRQGLKNSCPTLFIAFELRQWLKENHTESPRLSLNSPSSLIRGALKTQLMVYIVSRYGVQGHRIFFDLQARIFFSRSWPRTARTIADIAGWISLTLEKRNETIRRVLR